jgi:hypothetical protein
MFWLLLACAMSPDGPRDGRSNQVAARKFHTRTVDCHGGADDTDIQSAISHSRSGDRIEVAPCTYEGSISFKGRAVRIVSTGGAGVTTILATPGEAAVKVKKGEGAGTELSGFTITGGGGTDEPSLEVQFSSLIISDSIITGNNGKNLLYSVAGHVTIERTRIEDNISSEGILLKQRRGMTILKDSTLSCGAADIGYTTEHGAAFVDGATVDCPGAIGVEVYHSDGRVQRSTLTGTLRVDNEVLEDAVENTIVEDCVLLSGAVIETAHATLRNVVSLGTLELNASHVILESSIITGATCGVSVADTDVIARNDDFWANTADVCGDVTTLGGEQMLSVDPQFMNAPAGDFRLNGSSKLVNAGPDEPGYADVDGSVNDLGAYGGPLTIGGGW